MIISHKYKYIFIHCRKTAGSSISFMLSKSLGPWDIQLGAISETLEAGQPIPLRMWGAAVFNSGLHLPRRVLFRRGLSAHDLIAQVVKRAYHNQLGNKPQHANADTISAAFPKEWKSYTKFCVVRNPFSQVVSHYNWRMRKFEGRPSFLEYLKALEMGDDLGGAVPVGTHNNWLQYSINDRVAVDHVIRFENLHYDLEQVLAPLGVSFDGVFPRLKDLKSPSKNDPIMDYYTQESRDIVSNLYRNEIETFGYEFE